MVFRGSPSRKNIAFGHLKFAKLTFNADWIFSAVVIFPLAHTTTAVLVELHVGRGEVEAARPSPRHNDSWEIMDFLTKWEASCRAAD